jgi:hypothetical protein
VRRRIPVDAAVRGREQRGGVAAGDEQHQRRRAEQRQQDAPSVAIHLADERFDARRPALEVVVVLRLAPHEQAELGLRLRGVTPGFSRPTTSHIENFRRCGFGEPGIRKSTCRIDVVVRLLRCPRRRQKPQARAA